MQFKCIQHWEKTYISRSVFLPELNMLYLGEIRALSQRQNDPEQMHWSMLHNNIKLQKQD